MIREFHLFAGIGGGIYAGELLGHECCGGVEIMDYAQRVLRQRQADGWMCKFPLYSDLRGLRGEQFRNRFDVLCGGFPCQAFSTAAHGKNIAAKNLWQEMFRFVKESDAPIVFGENVVLRAIEKAKADLESIGYRVERIRLGNGDLGADHQRNRFWLLAVRDQKKFETMAHHLESLPKLTGRCWEYSPDKMDEVITVCERERKNQLLGIGNAQSPLVAASAFRMLVNRHHNHRDGQSELPTETELTAVFEKRQTWISKRYGGRIKGVHTPTTCANYCCPSMQKHQGCRNYVEVFCGTRKISGGEKRPLPTDAEYLMGFPIGASCTKHLSKNNIEAWRAK